MEIVVKYLNGVTTILSGTATTAAYLTSEGHEVWLTDASWKRVHARMNKLGLTTPEVDPSTDGMWESVLDYFLDMEVYTTLEEEGGVEELWEELEMLGLVAEWDQLDEGWA